jgi:hypothetical protein
LPETLAEKSPAAHGYWRSRSRLPL